MENNQKPEWFELADNDRAVIRPSKKKSGPIPSLTLILAGVLVIPMGAGFALLSHENHSAIAAGTLNLTQDSPAANSSTPALPVNTITMPALSREDDESEDSDDDRAPVFANSVNTSPTPLVQPAPSAVTNVPVTKTTAAITPPGTSSASNELILPPTKKTDDDDEDEDDEEDDEEDDD